MILNLQNEIAVDLPALRRFEKELAKSLGLGRRTFNVCFVDDRGIKELNASFRGIKQPTDVLSFPWKKESRQRRSHPDEFANFLGDLVISTETARRNARAEGHSSQNEFRWLILHGLLHLLGYDHATDEGEMTALEHSLRGRLGLNGRKRAIPRRGKARKYLYRRHENPAGKRA